MSKISEITINGKALQDILDAHKIWRYTDAIEGRADLSDANLSGANLSGADLSGANLSDADLSGANLSDADLSGADLSDADLRRAYLSGANLSRANLSRADLSGANLSRANLSGANLSRAIGVYAFGPIGKFDRIGYAVTSEDGPMFALGCHWGNLAETRKAIVAKYGKGSLYEKQVVLAGKIVMEKK